MREDDARAQSALEQALDRQVLTGRTSRRRFVGRSAGAALMATGLASVLSACGIDGTAQENVAELQKEAASVRHPKVPIGNWTFSNWPLYMDKSVLKSFDRKYGGKVKYVEDINDNNDFFGKVRQQLTQDQPIGRDIVVLTDPMAARWVRSGFVTPYDFRNVPNRKNLVENLKTISYDPKRQFTLPFQTGAIGIGYDIRATGRELKSIKEFFNPQFKGKCTMLAEPYDSASTVLIMQGKDPAKASIDDMLGAVAFIEKAAGKGQFRRFTGNDYTTDLTKGNVELVLAYSGDMVQLQADNPNLRFAYPEEGAVTFTDNLMLPANVAHPYAAETMFNYLYEPDMAAKLCAYINYISPVDGIRPILEKTDPDIAKNELIFPTDEIRKRLRLYPSLSTREEQQMYEAMAKVTGA
ncbi:polyamine ABC transporter substrate-binding protein [Patulibacter minatonensis]|uniref:polyamine ABC transporter substrate-binding protein n=1 Tax=Patulibacter minatonensis TaxID=298163 RepID=UPI00047C1F01|nr:spermidine/putrescine ABC transporter substrate-binding protein [Patulibacter minatonensis]